MKLDIIGFSGKIATGKTTACEWGMSTYGGKLVRFAGPLKRLCGEIFGLDPAAKGKRERRVMQQFGTEGVRAINTGTWLRLFFESLPENSAIWVDDVRFPNEAEFIWQLGGKVIRLEPNDFGLYVQRRDSLYGIDHERDCHGSETALDEYDWWDGTIVSDTPEEMFKQLDRYMDAWEYMPLKAQALHKWIKEAEELSWDIPPSDSSRLHDWYSSDTGGEGVPYGEPRTIYTVER